MEIVTHAELRRNPATLVDGVARDHSPLIIRDGNGKDVVMLSLAEYRSMAETFHLPESPANAERLRRSACDARDGLVEMHDLVESGRASDVGANKDRSALAGGGDS